MTFLSELPLLASEWHPTLNGELTPEMMSAGSSRHKVWWLGKCGHEWDMLVSSRTSKHSQGCPYCSGQRILVGFNDLATVSPEVVAEWHPTLNDALTPEMVTMGSEKRVWWLGKCGHEWDMAVSARTGKRSQGCPYCAKKRLTNNSLSLVERYPELAAQWHPTLNGGLTPQDVKRFSSKTSIWWLAECGHEWEAFLSHRTTSGSLECPLCNGSRIVAGVNDLASQKPEFLTHWHFAKNSVPPDAVSMGSRKQYWWKSDECGHEWQAEVASYVKAGKVTCLYCSKSRLLIGFNDLATTHPIVANLWHPTLNGDLRVDNVSSGSEKIVWWIGECGHEWDEKISSSCRRDISCPFCANRKLLVGFNDLAITHPPVAQEWHPTLNGELSPEMVMAHSAKRVWWLGKCGHEWDMRVVSRTNKRPQNCPACAGRRVLAGFNDLASQRPDLVAEWHPLKNKDRKPTAIGAGSAEKVWWQCTKGHEWQAKIVDRTRMDGKATGCPTCAASIFISRGEQEIADYLSRELGLTIEQSNRKLLNGTEIDIYIPSKRLAIEYNGVYWHSTASLSSHQYHQKKYEQAQQAGIQLLQIWEDEWRDKPELVKRLLAHKLGESREPLIGARSTRIGAIPLAEARAFLNEYHIQGHSNGSYYLGLRSQKTNQLVAVMVLVKQANPNGFTLEIVRYATSCRVPGGFTKLLKYVETTLNPSRLVTFADHCISDSGLYAQNGFTAEKELAPDYRYLVQGQRAHKFGYRLERFKSDPSLLWEPNLTETQLAQLNGLRRIYDAGKTRWVKTFPVS